MKVFISHSERDESWAERLREGLTREGINVWNWRSELAPGENWGLEIGKGLEASDAMIVLWSPASAKSSWIRHEIEYALSRPRFRDRLIPVVVRPTAEIPWILEKQQLIRASKNIEGTVRDVTAALKKAAHQAK